MAEDMQINPQRAKQLAENIASITSRINAVSKGGKQVRPPQISQAYQNLQPTSLTRPRSAS